MQIVEGIKRPQAYCKHCGLPTEPREDHSCVDLVSRVEVAA